MKAEIRLVRGEGTAEDWAEVQRWQRVFSTDVEQEETGEDDGFNIQS